MIKSYQTVLDTPCNCTVKPFKPNKAHPFRKDYKHKLINRYTAENGISRPDNA